MVRSLSSKLFFSILYPFILTELVQFANSAPFQSNNNKDGPQAAYHSRQKRKPKGIILEEPRRRGHIQTPNVPSPGYHQLHYPPSKNNMVSTPFKKNTKFKKGKSRNGKNRKSTKTRHIEKLPPPTGSFVGDPPSGLIDDQKNSDENYDDSIESQKEAFEAMLDDHQRHPKRRKNKINDDEKYMTLTYDYINRKYTITEE